VRRGPVTLRYVPRPADGPPRVAYAIGQGVGGAVARNRARRRLRAAVDGLAGELVAGSYLFGGDAPVVTMPFSELCTTVAAAAREATEPGR
jgi:ribonuclease P protein component